MKGIPPVVGSAVAIVAVALLVAGILGVPYRAMLPPGGYDQPRVHLQTKQTTRFAGPTAAAVAAQVARAVYPATRPENTPSTIILYEPSDIGGALAAAPLLRPLDALLVPSDIDPAELTRLGPSGDGPAGVQALLLGEASLPAGSTLSSQRMDRGEVPAMLTTAGLEPLHAVLVDLDDPGTAVLAAPWAAVSGDLVITDPADAPAGIPTYALGAAEAGDDATRIDAGSPAATAVAFAAYGDPEDARFGWAMDEETLTGYRAFVLARPDDPATAVLAANLARRGRPGPLLYSDERTLPEVTNAYLWSQRPAWWIVPNEGPFHHVFVLGDETSITFPAQSQADYALEIGPYRLKGPGLAGLDMLAAAWIVLGMASALWIAVHGARRLPGQHWVMRLAWPLLAFMLGPFGLPLYWVAYSRPVLKHDGMSMWDRPLWLQGLVATASAVGFGGLFMVATGFLMTTFGLPLIFGGEQAIFWLGTPMILLMMANYVVAVLISWPLYQTPMIAMYQATGYPRALLTALPIVLVSMASVSLAMFPSMWWLMMIDLTMMPSEESILWFGVMFLTVALGFLISWPFNYAFVRRQIKSGLM